MLQDIAPYHLDNAYHPVPPEKDSIALYYENHVCLMRRTESEISFPTFGDLERLNEDIYDDAVYLFSIGEERYYLVRNINLERLSRYQMEHTELFRQADPQYRAFAGITGYQLYRWYESRRFCGRCGSRMRPDAKERMMYCEKCGNMEYPKICPAVIIGITDGNRMLLTQYANRNFKRYALVAGYTEIGETLEETVHREVMEEVGLKVKNLRYYKSQPWAFSDTILVGMYCELDGDDAITLEQDELACARWFERDEIPVEPRRDSLTNEMIMKFKNHEI